MNTEAAQSPMSDRAWLVGLWVIAAAFVAVLCAWFWTIGPLGQWRWREAVRLNVPAMPPMVNYQDLSSGPYETSPSFSLGGAPARVEIHGLTFPSRSKNPLHADVTYAVAPATTPGTGSNTAMFNVDHPGRYDGGSWRVTFLVQPGANRLFVHSSAATTVSVLESRDHPRLVAIVLAILALAWLLLRIRISRRGA